MLLTGSRECIFGYLAVLVICTFTEHYTQREGFKDARVRNGVLPQQMCAGVGLVVALQFQPCISLGAALEVYALCTCAA